MGLGFVLMLWLVIAAILGAIWIAAVVLFITFRKDGLKVGTWLSGVVVVALPLMGILTASVTVYDIVRASIPTCVFNDTFHSAPGEDVRNITSKVWWFADVGSVYIRFETDIDTFRELVPEGLPKVTREEFEQKMWGENSDPPTWWKPPFAAGDEIYLTSTGFGNGKEFASESTIFTYDSQNHVAYYHFIGID
jgi:hypothetical protein